MKYIVTLLLIISINYAHGQKLTTNHRDSILQIWNDTSKGDSVKFDALQTLITQAYLYSNPDSAQVLSNDYLQRALRLSDKKNEASILGVLGTIYSVKGKIDSSLHYYLKSSSLSTSLKDTSNMIRASFNVATAYKILGNTQKCLEWYEKSNRLSVETNFLPGIARNNYSQGVLLYGRGSMNDALAKFEKALEVQKKIGNNLTIGLFMRSVSDVQKALGNSILALDGYYDALKLIKKEGSEFEEARTLVNISSINSQAEDFEEALIKLEEAISIFQRINSTNGLSNAYREKAKIYEQQGLLDESLKNLELGYQIDKENSNPETQCFSLAQIGRLHLELGDFSKALEYSEQSRILATKLGLSKNNITNDYVSSDAFYALGNLKKAEKYAQSALIVAQNSGDIKDITNSSLSLYRAQKANGNSPQALSSHEIFAQFSDSLNNLDKKKSLIKRELKAHFEKEAFVDSVQFAFEKKILIKQNNTQKTITKGVLIALAIVGFLSFFLFRSNKIISSQKEQISTSLKEKDTLLREIHHRVKNNLQVVSSLLRLQTRATSDEAAIDALTEGQNRVQSMSLIHQNLYQKENLTGIKMKDYLENLSSNLFETYKVDADRITLQLDIQDFNLDVDTVVPLGLIINELVSNALKYAFPNQNTGLVTVSLKEENNTLILNVSDNGIGINTDIGEANTDSFGYTLINTFVKKLKAELTIANEDGTSVSLDIKNYEIHP